MSAPSPDHDPDAGRAAPRAPAPAVRRASSPGAPPDPVPPVAPPRWRDRLEGLIGWAHLKLGLRATVAAVAAYGLAYFLALPNGYWAVLTAILVVQSTLGASLSVAVDRALGTVVGGVIGVAAADLVGPSVPLTFLALGVGVLLTSTLAARFASFKLAPVTVGIVLLSDPSHAEPLLSGLHRVLEIAVGGVVGVACAILILPERALVNLFPYCATALRLSASLLEHGRDGMLGRGLDPAALDRLNAGVRKALRAADARIADARAERAGRLASHADPAPVVRTCRRLWHSVIILLRGADQPLAEPLASRLAPHLDAAVAALRAHIDALATRLEGGVAEGFGQTVGAARSAVAALEAEAERLNAEGALDAASGETLAALFAAVSACAHVEENLEDLSARLDEVKGADG
ncbi:FUSC family protein [Xanthobacter sp. KR7-225]|uniref:FUSC family protein n=1 Tax=Xanthobacter sp. KR7-225 TaxID=3156613 RepID=UPI0032B36283